MIMALLTYYTLVLASAFVWPTWRLWRRERINALVLPRDDTARRRHWYLVQRIDCIGCRRSCFDRAWHVAAAPSADELAWLNPVPADGVGWALLAWSRFSSSQLRKRIWAVPGGSASIIRARRYSRVKDCSAGHATRSSSDCGSICLAFFNPAQCRDASNLAGS